MTIHPANVSFSKIQFDDYIKHENRKVQFTHYDMDEKTPLFLQFIDDVAQPAYCIGFSNAITWLKTGILKEIPIKKRVSKTNLDGKILKIISWKKHDDSIHFQINYDGKDLEIWEFEREIFPELSDLKRSKLNLFSPWFKNIFSSVDDSSENFPSTFRVDHYNLAVHIVERIGIVKKEILKNS